MSLTVHHSHRTELLVDVLAEQLQDPRADPFAADVVVVHGKGLERWLSMQLAQRHGICANVRFPTARELLDEALVAVVGPDSGLDTWSTDAITWALMAEFREATLAGPSLEPVRRWLTADASREAREVALAGQIARVFERYAIYRPAQCADWSSGGGEGWEPALWRAVTKRLPGHNVAELADQFEAGIPAADLSGLPKRIAMFAVGALPPLSLRMLVALAQRRDIQVLRLAATNPSRGTPDLHPLLASCGIQARELRDALVSFAPVAVHKTYMETAEPTTDLQRLQADLVGCVVSEASKALDQAVEIHSCHGPTRQVQVLRNVLLRLLNDDETLQPRDIIVMTPDVERFAPHIDAIFPDGANSWADRHLHPGGLPRLPFRIADRWIRSDNPVAAVLMAVLDLVGGRLTSTQVLDVLRIAAVREHLELSLEDLAVIQDWVQRSGVRWGADEKHRAREEQPETDAYTWRFGLDRLLLGQAMAGDEEFLLNTLTTGDIEGKDERRMLGALSSFVDIMIGAATELTEPRGVSEWRDRLLALIDALTSPPGWMREEVRSGLEEMVRHAKSSGFIGELSLPGVVELLRGRFTVADIGRRFLDGGITVCQLVPMRSIPFRVVVLLGMDDGTFPREDRRPAFDRMSRTPMAGDRNARIDDRALFLEAVLSARERLVVLYTGCDPADGTLRPPAVPVVELIDVLQAKVVKHPLRSYGPRVFLHPVTGHDKRQLAASNALFAPPLSAPPFLTQLPEAEPNAEVPLQWLVSFFRSPTEFLCNRRLGLWPERDAESLTDREPIEPPRGLDGYALRSWLLAAALEGKSLQFQGDVCERIRRHGLLPLGKPGDTVYIEFANQAATIAAEALQHRDHALPPLIIDELVDGLQLRGHVGDRFSGGIVRCQAGRVTDKSTLALWIEHLVACMVSAPQPAQLFGLESEVTLRPIPSAAATERLADLIAVYRLGWSRPLPFWAKQGMKYLTARDQPKPGLSPEESGCDVFGKWPPQYGLDDHSRRVWPTCPYEVGSEATGLATRILLPMREATI
jgi:exodeoxyribonuclease V gamma subunit